MANIATSARSSLQDVRQVLAADRRQPRRAARRGGLDELVDGRPRQRPRGASTEVGTPQPLPPELDVVAYRVLQEMLTNAIKHGRARPARARSSGTGRASLRIEVRNVVDCAATRPSRCSAASRSRPGQGLDGMRRRLEAVGGRLDVRRRDEDRRPTFTATAWVPVSGR